MFRKALTGKVLHEIHGEVLISNIENEIGSSLVDSLGNVGLGQQVINLVGISGEVLVYQVEWIPLPVIGEVVGLGFPERMESFIQKVVQIEVEIVLDKIYRNREIVLENIYYDLDKADIRSDAEPTLNKLADILRRNPSVYIQLGSHTDCRGNDPYNMTLSQRRAESAVDFLIRAGISAERLSAKGYGESQPAADCSCSRCSEAEHQMNRRTTFRIL